MDHYVSENDEIAGWKCVVATGRSVEEQVGRRLLQLSTGSNMIGIDSGDSVKWHVMASVPHKCDAQLVLLV